MFEQLYQSARRGELLLVDGGMCRYRLRLDGRLTIYEIIAHPPGYGVGTRMLNLLRQVGSAKEIVARCPADLPANIWYAQRGFELMHSETIRSGRGMNTWRLALA